MFKWFRRLLLAGLVTLAVGFLVFGTHLFSYVRTGYREARNRIRSTIPIEFEILRLEDLLEDLGPELHKVKERVAEEQVGIRHLERELQRLRQRGLTEREELRALRAALGQSTGEVRVGRLRYTRAHVEADLARRLDRIRALRGLIASKERLLQARRRALEAAKQKLARFDAERTRLAAAVEELRAELRELQTLQAGTLKVAIDESRLDEARRLADKVRTRLEVARAMLANEQVLVPAVPAPTPTRAEDVVAAVDAFLAEGEGRTATGR